MTHTFDPVSFEAFERLLARPDPRDLPRRANLRRYEGDPNRRATRLPPIMMAWLQRRYLDHDVPEPVAFATRMPKRPAWLMNQGLGLLQLTAASLQAER